MYKLTFYNWLRTRFVIQTCIQLLNLHEIEPFAAFICFNIQQCLSQIDDIGNLNLQVVVYSRWQVLVLWLEDDTAIDVGNTYQVYIVLIGQMVARGCVFSSPDKPTFLKTL